MLKRNKHSTLGGEDAYFLLCWSMYVRATKTNVSKDNTSIVVMGITLLRKTRGRKAKLASDFCSIVQVDYTIFMSLTQAKSCQFYY